MAQFRFDHQADSSIEVFVRKRQWESIGFIWPFKESGNGRHSFVLDCDVSDNPQVFRSMELAAEALLTVDTLVRQAKRRNWPLDQLVATAWAHRPRGSKPPPNV